jgi:hypothetical protein
MRSRSVIAPGIPLLGLYFWLCGASDRGLAGSTCLDKAQDAETTIAEGQSNTTQTDKEALAAIRQLIGDRGAEPAEKVFQHIEVLKGKQASRLPGMMSALTGLLGVNCSYCHVPGRWESEEKKPKQITREQFDMLKTINDRYFRGEQKVNCWTCHRGHPIPQTLSPTRK